jgi:hypothetical protein
MPYLPCYYPLHIIFFLHLLSTNISVLNIAIFPLLLKPTTQKEKMDWNSLTRSATCFPSCRSCGVIEPSTVPFCLRVIIVFRDIIYVIIIIYS